MTEFLRQAGLLTPEHLRGLHVDVVGAGALGGSSAVALCKAGCGRTNRVTVTDFDVCEEHNLPTQWFLRSHVLTKSPKVDAVAETVALLTDVEIVPVRARFTGGEERRLGPVVILAVDSLAERRRIWGRLKGRRDISLLIDARMGAEILDLYALQPGTDFVAAYERSLDDGEPLREPCTERAVVYTVVGAAGFVASIVKAFARGEPFPRQLMCDFRHFLLRAESVAPPVRDD